MLKKVKSNIRDIQHEETQVTQGVDTHGNRAHNMARIAPMSRIALVALCNSNFP